MIDNWILSNRDRIIRNAGDEGMKVGDARSEVVERIVNALSTGEVQPLNTQRMAEAMYDQVVIPARQARRTALHRELDYIAAALRGETILGREDPRLWEAFPLGDGRDKTLALWTVDDWRGALKVRTDKLTEAQAAQQIFEDQVGTIVDAMFSAGVTTTGELFPDSGAGVA